MAARLVFALLTVACALGCRERPLGEAVLSEINAEGLAPEQDDVAATVTSNDESIAGADGGVAEVRGGGATDVTPLADGQHILVLRPRNMRINFVGTKLGSDGMSQKGSFETFVGEARFEGEQLRHIRVAIDTASLTTAFARLTNHLKSPDFFDVGQYPDAIFESTRIQPIAQDRLKITGDLTLLGRTETLVIPATVRRQSGWRLTSRFILHRQHFGMDYGLAQIDDAVKMNVTIDASAVELGDRTHRSAE